MLPSPLNHYGICQTSEISLGLLLSTYGVVFDKRGQLWIWHNSVKGAIDLFWYATSDLKVVNVSFETTWFHKPRKLRSFWKSGSLFVVKIHHVVIFESAMRWNSSASRCFISSLGSYGI